MRIPELLEQPSVTGEQIQQAFAEEFRSEDPSIIDAQAVFKLIARAKLPRKTLKEISALAYIIAEFSIGRALLIGEKLRALKDLTGDTGNGGSERSAELQALATEAEEMKVRALPYIILSQEIERRLLK